MASSFGRLSRQLSRSTCTNSLPRFFHYQQRKTAASLESRDLSYPNEILLRPECRPADRVRETVRLRRRKNLQLEERELRHLYPSNKCAKDWKPCQTSEEKRLRKNRLTEL